MGHDILLVDFLKSFDYGFSKTAQGIDTMQKLYVLSDGWPAYQYTDGSLGDMPNKTDADLTWDNLDQIMSWDEDTVEATQAQRDYYAELQRNNV